jgi:phosphoserine phosphatase
VAERYGGRVFQFSRELHAVAKEDGHKVAAISGSMWPAVKRFSEMRGFDVAVGTEPHRNGDRLSSERALDKVPMRDKAAEVARLAAQLDVDRRPTVVVGDTVSDIAMLALARYPIAFNPEAALARVARARGWALVYERKDSVLAFRAQLGPRKNALQEVPFSSILPVTLAHALEARLEKEGMLTYGG